MRMQCLYGQRSHEHVRPGGRSLRALIAGLAVFLLLLVQAAHPALHPHEVINATAGDQQLCPLSHTAAALGALFAPLIALAVIRLQMPAPQPWAAHPDFLHPLAPRPPPSPLS